MDEIVRTVTKDHAVRIIAAVTTQLSREACRRLEARELEATVLARMGTAACMLATLAKEGHERVMINVRGDGPLGRIIADAWGDGRARVCLERRLEDDAKLKIAAGELRPSIAHAIGRDGTLTVTRDLGLDRQYQGSVDLISGELDTDIEHYLNTSEQLPSMMRCVTLLDSGGNVSRSAGVMAQILPGTDRIHLDEIRARLEEDTLREILKHDRSALDLAMCANGGDPILTHETTSLTYFCPCDEDHARRVVSSLGAADLEALADEQPVTDVRCHFCGENYALGSDTLRAIAAELRAQAS